MTAIIAVKHNIEVAHRLFDNKGKCEQIHGHSMNVTLKLGGQLDNKGFMDGVEFGALKSDFRKYLDETYDHRLLLNASDPFARPIYMVREGETVVTEHELAETRGVKISWDFGPQLFLPGLQAMEADPTTENIAKWIYRDMKKFGYPVWEVEVWETAVNMASYIGDED